MEHNDIKYWSIPSTDLIKQLSSSSMGLSEEEANVRLAKYGPNTIVSKKKKSGVWLLINQFKNPIIIILLIATFISALTGELVDSIIIFAIILVSTLLSFLQEYSASNAIEELKAHVKTNARILRDNKEIEIPTADVVPGDILLLSAGSLIAADGLLIESLDLFVNQSVLTGESIPQEKAISIIDEKSSIDKRNNCVYMGTNVQSGTGKAIVVNTGTSTEFGKIAKHLQQNQYETEFEIGVRHFGYLLSQIMLILTIAVFAINVIFNKSPIDSLLFSVALAVGITPQLLPAIISITLSKGSKVMAKEGVIVKKLSSIENFGGMDILCTDKTGTLTEGVIQLDDVCDINGHSDGVFRYAYINAYFQAGLSNALDVAIQNYKKVDTQNIKKVDEIPYDFFRKRLSVIVEENNVYTVITKGALNNILSICGSIMIDGDDKLIDDKMIAKIQEKYLDWSDKGMRVLGVAKRCVPIKDKYGFDDEIEMTFLGFLLFFDPPKDGVKEVLNELEQKGISLRIVTGDNQYVAMHTAVSIGLENPKVITGTDLIKLNDVALQFQVESTNIFAEVDPNQKERIIVALKKGNHVVGYMGDGINDVPALHAADIGISVNTAVDVAKESADFVLFEKNLEVLSRGIDLGRTTFENTLKYILITTSANFGNMFSMAGVSLLMPFLPLLPKQILLINFLTDFPALTIAGDSVDEDLLRLHQRWNIKFIRNFMFIFGLISSGFDYIAFGVLLILFKADEKLFQSSWFILSIITELIVLLIMRTRKPFFKSKPSPLLVYSIIGVTAITLLIVYLPINSIFGLQIVPTAILSQLLIIVFFYAVATEIGKHFYFKK